MSELVPAQAPTPPPGWYVDTTGHQRWWDGAAWGVYAPAASAQTHAQAQTHALVRTAKDTGTAYLFAILLGGVAAHHFYLGHAWSGVIFLVLWWVGWATVGIGVGFVMLFAAVIWWIVDMCSMGGYVKTANHRLQQGR
jgi:TM2 domain-containing membrane protein YozV